MEKRSILATWTRTQSTNTKEQDIKKSIVVIPDTHAHPDLDNDRFEWLGKFILDRKPDIVLALGDFYDMPSLSSYDKGTKGFEGRRYKKDIEAGIDAQERLWAPVAKYNKLRLKNKKAQYVPERVMAVGNHEERVDRVVNMSPELHGTIGESDYQFSKYWNRIIPFKQTEVVEGFAVSHYFPAGLLGRPIGGENPADAHLKKLSMSAIAGHSHLLDIKTRTKADGTKMMALIGGCYVHQDMVETWNKNTYQLWWNGITYLTDVENGYAEGVEFITQERLRRNYP